MNSPRQVQPADSSAVLTHPGMESNPTVASTTSSLASARRRWKKSVLWLIGGTVVAAVMCLGWGPQPIGYRAMATAIGRALHQSPSLTGDVDGLIILHIRLPRILLAFVIGASLAGVGVALQALLRNPLADPYVLGVSSGAALGASLALSFGVTQQVANQLSLPAWAFLGSLAAIIVVYRLALSDGRLFVHTLLLAGVVINAILSALILFITSLLDPGNLFRVMAWLVGNVPSPDFGTLAVLTGYSAVGLAGLFALAPRLNILALGEESALSLGLDVERTKKVVLLIAALLTGAAVSMSGMIAFVGMIIPHMLRVTVGADHRILLPTSALVGGSFLMVCDTLARSLLAPLEIPVGVVTALLGGPLFIGLLTSRTSYLTGHHGG